MHQALKLPRYIRASDACFYACVRVSLVRPNSICRRKTFSSCKWKTSVWPRQASPSRAFFFIYELCDIIWIGLNTCNAHWIESLMLKVALVSHLSPFSAEMDAKETNAAIEASLKLGECD